MKYLKMILYLPFLLLAVILFLAALLCSLISYLAFKLGDKIELVVAYIIAYALGVYKTP